MMSQVNAATSAGSEVQEVEINWVVGANVLSAWAWGMWWLATSNLAPERSVAGYWRLLEETASVCLGQALLASLPRLVDEGPVPLL